METKSPPVQPEKPKTRRETLSLSRPTVNVSQKGSQELITQEPSLLTPEPDTQSTPLEAEEEEVQKDAEEVQTTEKKMFLRKQGGGHFTGSTYWISIGLTILEINQPFKPVIPSRKQDNNRAFLLAAFALVEFKIDHTLYKQLLKETEKMPTNIPESLFEKLWHFHITERWQELLIELKNFKAPDGVKEPFIQEKGGGLFRGIY